MGNKIVNIPINIGVGKRMKKKTIFAKGQNVKMNRNDTDLMDIKCYTE